MQICVLSGSVQVESVQRGVKLRRIQPSPQPKGSHKSGTRSEPGPQDEFQAQAQAGCLLEFVIEVSNSIDRNDDTAKSAVSFPIRLNVMMVCLAFPVDSWPSWLREDQAFAAPVSQELYHHCGLLWLLCATAPLASMSLWRSRCL